MNWIENLLANIEFHLRAIIEGNSEIEGVPRKFAHQIQQVLVSAMLAEASRVQQDTLPGAVTHTVPDQYTLVLPAEQASLLSSHPAALDMLAHKLSHTATQRHLLLPAPPLLRVVSSPTAVDLEVLTEFSHTGEHDSYTALLDDQPAASDGDGIPPQAFLIVNGLTTFPLVQAVTNIGSGSDNHLVLEDPGVSRKHAQLRLINKRFTIFDLDSRRGTYVNGVPVASQVLNPGDVILLAGVPIVYGHETADHVGYTQELPAPQPRLDIL